MEKRADEVGVLDWLVGQVALQPGRNAFEFFVPLGQYPGLY